MLQRSLLLRIAGPTVLVSVILLGLCTATAVYLYRQQATTAQILDENVVSRKIDHELETAMNDLIAVHRDGSDQVEALHERILVLLAHARELAATEEERSLVRQLAHSFTRYRQRWGTRVASMQASGEDAVTAAMTLLETETLPLCRQLREYHSRRIEQVAAVHRHIVHWMAWGLASVGQIFPPDLDAFVLLSSHKSAICRDPSRVMLLSTLPPVWEGHLQGLENLGLLRIGAGQARNAVGLIQGIGQQTETIESGYGVRNRDPMRRVLRGAKCSRQAPLQLSAEFQCEQTHEDMTAGPPFLTDEDRAHFQQPGLHRAEVIFDVRQVLIARVGRVRIEQGRGHVGLEDITAC